MLTNSPKHQKLKPKTNFDHIKNTWWFYYWYFIALSRFIHISAWQNQIYIKPLRVNHNHSEHRLKSVPLITFFTFDLESRGGTGGFGSCLYRNLLKDRRELLWSLKDFEKTVQNLSVVEFPETFPEAEISPSGKLFDTRAAWEIQNLSEGPMQLSTIAI